ncbi:hypothetical protein AXG93_3310s1110 [Marchantia polymorpha subsp. ruderalis]|uniref:Uncharacterized protein n=1 Tax=Marchantia polymorpha subsp. ruderalis TaxID=1480154 RepID=A0A176W2L8_MARPO|nr:hypothetical protein AXG93_3310s1110 [Marchantia polymorpha subsp. ruderalis]
MPKPVKSKEKDFKSSAPHLQLSSVVGGLFASGERKQPKMLHLREDMRTALPTAFTISSNVHQGPRKLLEASDPGQNTAPDRGGGSGDQNG